MKIKYNSTIVEQKSGSMTTVIPKPFVEMCDMYKGQKLEWTAEFKKGSVTLTVKNVDDTDKED